MRYFLHKGRDMLDYYDDLTWYRRYKDFGVVRLFDIALGISSSKDHYLSHAWQELSEKDARVLIAKWAMQV